MHMFRDSLSQMVTVIQVISQWLTLLSHSNSNKQMHYTVVIVRKQNQNDKANGNGVLNMSSFGSDTTR
jgi:hypothetical protein